MDGFSISKIHFDIIIVITNLIYFAPATPDEALKRFATNNTLLQNLRLDLNSQWISNICYLFSLWISYGSFGNFVLSSSRAFSSVLSRHRIMGVCQKRELYVVIQSSRPLRVN